MVLEGGPTSRSGKSRYDILTIHKLVKSEESAPMQDFEENNKAVSIRCLLNSSVEDLNTLVGNFKYNLGLLGTADYSVIDLRGMTESVKTLTFNNTLLNPAKDHLGKSLVRVVVFNSFRELLTKGLSVDIENITPDEPRIIVFIAEKPLDTKRYNFHYTDKLESYLFSDFINFRKWVLGEAKLLQDPTKQTVSFTR